MKPVFVNRAIKLQPKVYMDLTYELIYCVMDSSLKTILKATKCARYCPDVNVGGWENGAAENESREWKSSTCLRPLVVYSRILNNLSWNNGIYGPGKGLENAYLKRVGPLFVGFGLVFALSPQYMLSGCGFIAFCFKGNLLEAQFGFKRNGLKIMIQLGYWVITNLIFSPVHDKTEPYHLYLVHRDDHILINASFLCLHIISGRF